VLTGIDPISVCTGYELGGRALDAPPSTQSAWERVTPVYEEMPGWKENLGSARTIGELPTTARSYVERLASLVGAPVALLSVGAPREQTIRLGQMF
jgi:adenylosuccinate synthase